LHGDEPWQLAGEPAERDQLVECLADADQTDTAAGRVHDHVRHPPTQLLDDLHAHRLLALDAVRLLECRGVEPAVGDGLAGDPSGVADQTVHYVQTSAGQHALHACDGRRLLRHHDQRRHAGAGRVGGPRGARVSVGGHGDPLDTELTCPGHADRGAACLEAARR
jgi:hypothetical protein